MKKVESTLVESTLIAIVIGIILTAQQTAFATNNSTNSTLGTPVATSGPATCFRGANGDYTCESSIGTGPNGETPTTPTLNVDITGSNTTTAATSPNATVATNED